MNFGGFFQNTGESTSETEPDITGKIRRITETDFRFRTNRRRDKITEFKGKIFSREVVKSSLFSGQKRALSAPKKLRFPLVI